MKLMQKMIVRPFSSLGLSIFRS